MRILCLDLGNTRAQAGVLSGGTVLWQDSVPTPLAADPAQGLAPRLAALAAGAHAPEAISLCSVVPAVTAALRPALSAAGLPVYQLTWEDCPALGLPLEYPQPAQIGQDRLAVSLAAKIRCGAPVVAIDMGTAATLDVINARGAFEGGIIAPGLGIMTRYLHERTALLPKLDPDDLLASAGFGQSTVEAMKIGCSVGFAGMIRALLDRVLAELRARGDGEAKVIATGGSLGNLPRSWLGAFEFDPALLLRGLEAAWLRKHGKS